MYIEKITQALTSITRFLVLNPLTSGFN